MHSITFDITNSRYAVLVDSNNEYNRNIPDLEFTNQLAMALRSAMQIDKNITTAVITAAVDFVAGSGDIVSFDAILKKRFPNGYKPSQW